MKSCLKPTGKEVELFLFVVADSVVFSYRFLLHKKRPLQSNPLKFYERFAISRMLSKNIIYLLIERLLMS